MNADSRSMVFVLDQTYTAVGENGITARFTFNPTSEAVFSGVFVEVELEDMIFDFKPSEPMLISGKNNEGLDVFMFTGKVPTLLDESGKKWSETVAKKATFVIEVTMERNGTSSRRSHWLCIGLIPRFHPYFWPQISIPAPSNAHELH
jgi:hypothetical protein